MDKQKEMKKLLGLLKHENKEVSVAFFESIKDLNLAESSTNSYENFCSIITPSTLNQSSQSIDSSTCSASTDAVTMPEPEPEQVDVSDQFSDVLSYFNLNPDEIQPDSGDDSKLYIDANASNISEIDVDSITESRE